MLIGKDLSSAIWNSVGGVFVLAVLVIVVFKFFVGQNKNIPAGIGTLVGVAAIVGFILSPDTFIGIGSTVVGVLTGKGAAG